MLVVFDSLFDDAVELGDLATLLTHDVLCFTLLLRLLLVLLHESLKLLGLETVLMMFGGKGLVLGVDFIL